MAAASEDSPVIEFAPSASSRPAGESIARFDELRERHPWFRSSFGHGFWVLTRYDAIVEAYKDTELFSSKAITVLDPEPRYRWIPEMLDPPEHTTWRRLLRPLFAPDRVNSLVDAVRQRCADIVDDLAAKGSCDFVTDFARVYPTTIFLELMGMPVDRLGDFLEWEDAILHQPASPERAERRMQAMQQITGYFSELIEQRRDDPGDDIVSVALTWRIDGEAIPDSDLLSLCMLLFLAGLDTVTSQLSYAFWHLATHDGDRRRIVEDPGVIPSAVDELMRAYSIVLPARKVTRDTVFHGCPMRAGDMVMLPITMANRDPDTFSDPEKVVLDRQPNQHIGFGAGAHRCLGVHLARREMEVALEEWHKRIPDYRVPEGGEVVEHAYQLLGLDSLPLTWRT